MVPANLIYTNVVFVDMYHDVFIFKKTSVDFVGLAKTKLVKYIKKTVVFFGENKNRIFNNTIIMST